MCQLPVCGTAYALCIIYIYLLIAIAPSPGPQPPTGVSVDTLGDESVDVSWDAQLSMQCDVVTGNYSVR